ISRTTTGSGPNAFDPSRSKASSRHAGVRYACWRTPLTQLSPSARHREERDQQALAPWWRVGVNWNVLTDGLKALGVQVRSLSDYFATRSKMAADRRKAIWDWLSEMLNKPDPSARPIQKQSWLPPAGAGQLLQSKFTRSARRAQTRRCR